jgi:hypothetical protein
MITSRTPVLQILTPTGWAYVFCWSMTQGKVVTTADYRKALRGDQGNLAYFGNKAGAHQFRVTTAVKVAAEASPVAVAA